MTENRKVIRDHFDSGELRSEYSEDESQRKDGVSRHWYKNGQLMSEAEYRRGQAQGVLREWNENGRLIMYSERSNGKLHGHFQSWWDDGTPKEDGYYLNGERQAGYRWYRADGSLWTETPPPSAKTS